MMKKAVFRLSLVVLIILAGAGAFTLRTYHYAGEFKSYEPHYNGECTAVPGMPGSEDITIDRRHGIAFVSSYDRWSYRAGAETRGAIYSLEYEGNTHVPRELTKGFKSEFHPHGISLYQDPYGRTLLFAVNHTKAGNSIEIFEYRGGVLNHRETISHPLLTAPNDILAVGPRAFYVSIEYGSASSVGRILERFIPLKRAPLLYFDGEAMSVAADGIGFANGIAMSADGKSLYLAATMEKAVRVYARDVQTGKLEYRYAIPLGSFPDNIEMDAEGALYAACLSKSLTYMKHSKNGTIACPTQIMRIRIKGDNDYSVEEIYYDDGKNINAATVAAPFRGGMILGPSKDLRNHVLICRDGGSPGKK
jgi:arylesterase / paraoxonase